MANFAAAKLAKLDFSHITRCEITATSAKKGPPKRSPPIKRDFITEGDIFYPPRLLVDQVDGEQHGLHGLNATLGHNRSASPDFIAFVHHVESAKNDVAGQIGRHFVRPSNVRRIGNNFPNGSPFFEDSKMVPFPLIMSANSAEKRTNITAIWRVFSQVCFDSRRFRGIFVLLFYDHVTLGVAELLGKV